MSSEPDGRGIAGRVALVTGAGSGIGRATAAMLAGAGARVGVSDVRDAGAEAVAQSIRASGGDAVALALDVTNEGDWTAAVDALRDRWGGLHILVNNAGISRASPITAMTLDEWRLVHAVNLDGTFLGLRSCIPAIRAAGGGSIVNVASASGVKPAPGAAAYSSSKAAVLMLTRTAALECAREQPAVRINAVVPAGVRTEMWREMDFFRELVRAHGEEGAWDALAREELAGRFATPEEIARAIVWLCSGDAGYVTGTSLAVDFGFTAG